MITYDIETNEKGNDVIKKYAEVLAAQAEKKNENVAEEEE